MQVPIANGACARSKAVRGHGFFIGLVPWTKSELVNQSEN